ncbi:hypothetical protein CONPUDRAFT_75169 [Coniophora puteana RWD-64-598 SS2]|uniref:Uncharacterized protein n=1 Tax=Coniophora puteana (strain RWD-64-598) TaxID=741705 RepID=A0A5M3MHU5_CONPW|nr:uncharacterized protein CONPUDRAFT_75169 [Coniophora puteana RWD-64-598 SS2]EIW78510.1 hypothetical protein CONPUDRAFT_75169 [Coniophora puteana RWD-64-598 SS2]
MIIILLLDDSNNLLEGVLIDWVAGYVMSAFYESGTSILVSILQEEAQIAGAWVCLMNIPQRLGWHGPLGAAAALSLEIVLNIQIVRYVAKNLSKNVRRSAIDSTKGIAGVLIRDNLLYFFAVTAGISMTFFNQLRTFHTELSYTNPQATYYNR